MEAAMPFTTETKVSDIALSGFQNRQVLEEAKVDFAAVAPSHRIRPALIRAWRPRKS